MAPRRARARRWIAPLACVLLLVVSGTAPRSWAQERFEEEPVKAAFLYRFTGYVDWPRDALTGPSFTFAVMASDAMGAELARLLPGHLVKNLPAQVRTVRSSAEAADAQLLYVGAGYPGDLQSVVESLGTRPVLVVTDRPGALNAGAAINFMLVDQRVRFEISMPAVVRARLWVQPPLLAVAAHVRSIGPQSGVPPGDHDIARVPPAARRNRS